MGRTAHRGKGEQPARAPPPPDAEVWAFFSHRSAAEQESRVLGGGSGPVRSADSCGPGPEPGRERPEADKQLRPHPSEWEAAFERSGKNVGGSVPGRTGHAQVPHDGCGREADR